MTPIKKPWSYTGAAIKPAGAPALALDARGWQGGFAADNGHEIVVQVVNFFGDGFQELGAPCGGQTAKGRKRGAGSADSGIHFGFRGLDKVVWQRFAGAGIHALQVHGASAAAVSANKVLSGDACHIKVPLGNGYKIF